MGDLDRYRLPRARDGHLYVRIDGEIVEIIEDTRVVVDAFGIVSDWLR